MKPSRLTGASTHTFEFAVPSLALAAWPEKDTVVDVRRRLDGWELQIGGSFCACNLVIVRGLCLFFV
jgi:hypothetical protein